jgi:hypothetical protein
MVHHPKKSKKNSGKKKSVNNPPKQKMVSEKTPPLKSDNMAPIARILNNRNYF